MSESKLHTQSMDFAVQIFNLVKAQKSDKEFLVAFCYKMMSALLSMEKVSR